MQPAATPPTRGNTAARRRRARAHPRLSTLFACGSLGHAHASSVAGATTTLPSLSSIPPPPPAFLDVFLMHNGPMNAETAAGLSANASPPGDFIWMWLAPLLFLVLLIAVLSVAIIIYRGRDCMAIREDLKKDKTPSEKTALTESRRAEMSEQSEQPA